MSRSRRSARQRPALEPAPSRAGGGGESAGRPHGGEARAAAAARPAIDKDAAEATRLGRRPSASHQPPPNRPQPQQRRSPPPRARSAARRARLHVLSQLACPKRDEPTDRLFWAGRHRAAPVCRRGSGWGARGAPPQPVNRWLRLQVVLGPSSTACTLGGSSPSTMPPQQPDSTILKRIKARFAVELHPSKLENVTEGVREQLNASLLRCGPPIAPSSEGAGPRAPDLFVQREASSNSIQRAGGTRPEAPGAPRLHRPQVQRGL